MRVSGLALTIMCLCASAQGQVDFSHDLGTMGAPGSGVNLAPNAGEVFSANGVSNILIANLASMGLVAGDNIDAFDRGDVYTILNGVFRYPFLFSVEPGAVGAAPFPVWGQAPFNAADVYAMESGTVGHVLAYNEPGLGLLTAPFESIDAMTDSMIGPGNRVYFSLQQGSPTLLGNAWSGADVLTVVVGAPASLRRAFRANDIGLIPADELDGLAMFGRMDVNGDGVFDDINDSALVYFSVDETSVGVIGSDVRMRSQTSPFHGGDIYTTGITGTHTLMHKADTRIRLGAGDVLDALKLGSTDPLDPFPLIVPGFPDPNDFPEKPANCPPYRGSGVPIGCIWIEVCDSPVPAIVNFCVEVKLCDASGNVISRKKSGSMRGTASSDPNVKAKAIADAFTGIMLPKPDGSEIPIFKGIASFVPPMNVGRPGITGEVCMFVNQEVVDCGWNIDQICFSFSNWTANIIAKPVKGWFPDVKRRPLIQVEGVSEIDTVLRISTSNGFGASADDVIYAVPLGAGQSSISALEQISAMINDDGGMSMVSPDGVMTIVSLASEPLPSDDGVSGPLVWESGAAGTNSVLMTVVANLARGPHSPCSAADYAEPYGELNFFDVSAFLAAFLDGSGQADLVYDGEFNFFDVSAFLQLFAQGCPEVLD